jgi:hypothetical protein
MAVGVTLPPFPAAVDSYRPFKRRQEPNRLLKRRFETISANVGSDYLFRKIKEKYKKNYSQVSKWEISGQRSTLGNALDISWNMLLLLIGTIHFHSCRCHFMWYYITDGKSPLLSVTFQWSLITPLRQTYSLVRGIVVLTAYLVHVLTYNDELATARPNKYYVQGAIIIQMKSQNTLLVHEGQVIGNEVFDSAQYDVYYQLKKTRM